jgi:predicted membrane channel-forming protein YqfA (hemolysin III family)
MVPSPTIATPRGYHRAVHTHFHLGDILANSITHGVGAVLAIAGAGYLIAASSRGSAWVQVTSSPKSAYL